MQPTLPEKYYLAHAHELFGFLRDHCAHLLQAEEQAYLAGFYRLGEDAQCLLVRFLSRKPRYLARKSLNYEEIEQPVAALGELSKAGYVSNVRAADWHEFVPVVTKPVLLASLRAVQSGIAASTSKKDLVALARHRLSGEEAHLKPLRHDYLVRRQQTTIDYLLFLFFGDLRNRLQKFAMRDLGVLATRRKTSNLTARFGNQDEARSAFAVQCQRRVFNANPEAAASACADWLLTTKLDGSAAAQTRQKLVLEVGDQLGKTDPAGAIKLWRSCTSPQATEKWVRASYIHDCRDRLRGELELLREQGLDAGTQIFVEDFYARKYQRKRTSIYTDMLRESTHHHALDESWLGAVEQGVIQLYQQQDKQALFSENKLWRLLFAFTLWPLLYGREQAQFSEFEHLPASLSSPDFYADHQHAIELELQQLQDRQATIKRFSGLASQHYGMPTGLFRWNSGILDLLQTALLYSPEHAIANVLRRMAQDYRNRHDGYPDLLIVEDQQLRFEEVKSPGDVLRPNQLVSLNRLRRAGFSVDISQVAWACDPRQRYCVVDIETTGGRAGGNAITEIAVVTVQNQQVIDRWSTLINPGRPIPAYITRLTGIDNRMVAKAPTFSDIADELEARLESSIFVAHNVGFDYGFIQSAYQALNRSFKLPKYCTVRNARRHFPGLKSYSLGNLAEHFELDLKNAHRALSDATATAQLLIMLQQT